MLVDDESKSIRLSVRLERHIVRLRSRPDRHDRSSSNAIATRVQINQHSARQPSGRLILSTTLDSVSSPIDA
jgi:hypothetical protein